VVETPEPPIGGAAIQGTRGVILNVSEQYGANTVEVTKAVEAALQDLRPILQAQGIALEADLFRPANFIGTATSNVKESLILGASLVTLVIFLFLFDLRTAAISCMAIPLSLLAAVIVLERLGVTLNTMTLGGLAIAIGVVVDDAIIDVENIVRRMRENAGLGQPRPIMRVVLDACLEVRGAVVYATFAVILVVLPIMGLARKTPANTASRDGTHISRKSSTAHRSQQGRELKRFYLLNLACPVFPAAVFSVKVMAAPGAIAFFASPFKEFSPNGAKASVSRSAPLTISTEPV
jgi:hypothetical protein